MLVYNAPLGSALHRPEIVRMSYNGNNEISGYCDDGSLCVVGKYNMTSFLYFELQNLHTGAITKLQAVDLEWYYSNDAPSVDLRYQMSDGKLGGRALVTDVTARAKCHLLKVCVEVPDSNILAPLGVILMAQNIYTAYCSRPRLYQF